MGHLVLSVGVIDQEGTILHRAIRAIDLDTLKNLCILLKNRARKKDRTGKTSSVSLEENCLHQALRNMTT